MLLLGGAESMPKGNPRQGHVAIAAPGRETNDAQLFAQSAHAPGQTDQRSRLLHCHADLTAPTLAMMPVFHEISRAAGPSQQTTKGDGLSYSVFKYASRSSFSVSLSISL